MNMNTITLSFQQIIERTEREIEALRAAPVGSIFHAVEDFEISDEDERASLLEASMECIENLKKRANPASVEARYQQKSCLLADDFMDD